MTDNTEKCTNKLVNGYMKTYEVMLADTGIDKKGRNAVVFMDVKTRQLVLALHSREPLTDLIPKAIDILNTATQDRLSIIQVGNDSCWQHAQVKKAAGKFNVLFNYHLAGEPPLADLMKRILAEQLTEE